jgi:MFS family permease
MKLVLCAFLAFLAVADAKVHNAFTVSSKASIKHGDKNDNAVVDSSRLQASSLDTFVPATLVAADTSAAPLEADATWKGLLCVLGGALAHLTLGTYYCWGNFLSYSPDYLRFFDGETHPGVPPDALYVIPFTIIAQALAMPFGPTLSKAVGASRALLIGCSFAAASVYIASYQKSLASFMLFYSICFGAGTGIAYTAPMAAGWKWLPKSKGLVSGGVLAGFGSGGFIFSLVGSKYVNPTKANLVNGRFPDSVYNNFPGMLRRLASIYLVVAFLGSLLVSEPAPVPVQAVEGESAPAASTPTYAGLTPSEALKTSQFWLLWSMIISSATAGLNTASAYKYFAATSSTLDGDQYQAMVGGIGALFNGCGRLFWGSVSDKIGFKNSFTILTIFQAASMLTYKYSVNSKLAFAVNTCMLFFALAGNFALFPPVIYGLFGPKAGTVIYGMLYSAFATASVVGGIVTKLMVKSVGWAMVFQTLAFMSIVATLLVQALTSIASYSGSVL